MDAGQETSAKQSTRIKKKLWIPRGPRRSTAAREHLCSPILQVMKLKPLAYKQATKLIGLRLAAVDVRLGRQSCTLLYMCAVLLMCSLCRVLQDHSHLILVDVKILRGLNGSLLPIFHLSHPISPRSSESSHPTTTPPHLRIILLPLRLLAISSSRCRPHMLGTHATLRCSFARQRKQ